MSRNPFKKQQQKGSTKARSLVVVRDPTNAYTETRWTRGEFLRTLQDGFWPPDMIILDTTDGSLYIVRGNEFVEHGASEDAFNPQQLLKMRSAAEQLPYRHARRLAAVYA